MSKKGNVVVVVVIVVAVVVAILRYLGLCREATEYSKSDNFKKLSNWSSFLVTNKKCVLEFILEPADRCNFAETYAYLHICLTSTCWLCQGNFPRN